MLKPMTFFILLALGATAVRAETAQPAAIQFDSSVMVTLLDTESPVASRQSALADLMRHAEAGDSFAMYDLGSLLHQERFKNDPVIRYDPGAALMWLTRAFDAGRFTAAFKLSAIHRELGDHLEAMAWLQVYTYYLKGGSAPREKPQPLKRWGAPAWLMSQLQAELKAVPDETIRQRTIALLEQHGAKFEQAPETPNNAADGCEMRRPPKGFRLEGARRHDPSIVELVATIAPEGSATKSFIMDSVPDAMTARMAQQLGFAIRCPEVAADSPARHAFIKFGYQGADPYRSRGRESR